MDPTATDATRSRPTIGAWHASVACIPTSGSRQTSPSMRRMRAWLRIGHLLFKIGLSLNGFLEPPVISIGMDSPLGRTSL